jgi:hypothetical protein
VTSAPFDLLDFIVENWKMVKRVGSRAGRLTRRIRTKKKHVFMNHWGEMMKQYIQANNH